MTEATPLLQMRGITKRFPGVLANDTDLSVSFIDGSISTGA